MYEYPALLKDNDEGFKKLAKTLDDKEKILCGDKAFPFHLTIYETCKAGDVIQLVNVLEK